MVEGTSEVEGFRGQVKEGKWNPIQLVQFKMGSEIMNSIQRSLLLWGVRVMQTVQFQPYNLTTLHPYSSVSAVLWKEDLHHKLNAKFRMSKMGHYGLL